MREEFKVVLAGDSPTTLYPSPKTKLGHPFDASFRYRFSIEAMCAVHKRKESSQKQETLREEMFYHITARVTDLFFTGTRYSLLLTCVVAMLIAETSEYIIHPPFNQHDDMKLVTCNQQKSQKSPKVNRSQTPTKPNTSLLLRCWSLAKMSPCAMPPPHLSEGAIDFIPISTMNVGSAFDNRCIRWEAR